MSVTKNMSPKSRRKQQLVPWQSMILSKKMTEPKKDQFELLTDAEKHHAITYRLHKNFKIKRTKSCFCLGSFEEADGPSVQQLLGKLKEKPVASCSSSVASATLPPPPLPPSLPPPVRLDTFNDLKQFSKLFDEAYRLGKFSLIHKDDLLKKHQSKQWLRSEALRNSLRDLHLPQHTRDRSNTLLHDRVNLLRTEFGVVSDDDDSLSTITDPTLSDDDDDVFQRSNSSSFLAVGDTGRHRSRSSSHERTTSPSGRSRKRSGSMKRSKTPPVLSVSGSGDKRRSMKSHKKKSKLSRSSHKSGSGQIRQSSSSSSLTSPSSSSSLTSPSSSSSKKKRKRSTTSNPSGKRKKSLETYKTKGGVTRMIRSGSMREILKQLMTWLGQHNQQREVAKDMVRSLLRSYLLVISTNDLLDLVFELYREPVPMDSDNLSEHERTLQLQRIKEPILEFLGMWLEFAFYPDFSEPPPFDQRSLLPKKPTVTSDSSASSSASSLDAIPHTQHKRAPAFFKIAEFIQSIAKENPEESKKLFSWLDPTHRQSQKTKKKNSMLQVQQASSNKSKRRLGRTFSSRRKKSDSGRMTIGKSGGFFDQFRRMMAPLSDDPEFMELLPDEVETHLTLYEAKLFRLVSCRELLNKPWKYDSNNTVIAFITNRFNKVSKWVATTIVTEPTVKLRAEAIKRWIMIAQSCFKHYNFNSLMAIVAGLNHSAVGRLKNTWAEVSERHKEQLKHLENEEMSFVGHMRRYRANLEQALKERSPAVPLITVHIQDLFFINDSNETWIDKDKGILNFDKLYMVGRTIVQMEKLQTIPPYQEEVFDEDRAYIVKNVIAKLPNAFHEEALFQMSRKNEPREAKALDT